MTHDAAAGQRPDVTLSALSIVLVADKFDPSMINPDFLRHSGIVDPNLQIKQPAVSTPVFSEVIFEGGLSVVAQPDRFNVVQHRETLTEDIATPDIAKRFLEKVPYPSYKAIGINPTYFKRLNDASEGVATALIKGGKWMAFGGVSPAYLLKAVYSYEGKQIAMDVQDVKMRESGSSESSGLLFAGNIHRDILETDQVRRIARLMLILSEWEGDLHDFKNLATQFDSGRASS